QYFSKISAKMAAAAMPAAMTAKAARKASRAATGIHSGTSTHHHDQPMPPASLSTIKSGSRIAQPARPRKIAERAIMMLSCLLICAPWTPARFQRGEALLKSEPKGSSPALRLWTKAKIVRSEEHTSELQSLAYL